MSTNPSKPGSKGGCFEKDGEVGAGDVISVASSLSHLELAVNSGGFCVGAEGEEVSIDNAKMAGECATKNNMNHTRDPDKDERCCSSSPTDATKNSQVKDDKVEIGMSNTRSSNADESPNENNYSGINITGDSSGNTNSENISQIGEVGISVSSRSNVLSEAIGDGVNDAHHSSRVEVRSDASIEENLNDSAEVISDILEDEHVSSANNDSDRHESRDSSMRSRVVPLNRRSIRRYRRIIRRSHSNTSSNWSTGTVNRRVSNQSNINQLESRRQNRIITYRARSDERRLRQNRRISQIRNRNIRTPIDWIGMLMQRRHIDRHMRGIISMSKGSYPMRSMRVTQSHRDGIGDIHIPGVSSIRFNEEVEEEEEEEEEEEDSNDGEEDDNDYYDDEGGEGDDEGEDEEEEVVGDEEEHE